MKPTDILKFFRRAMNMAKRKYLKIDMTGTPFKNELLDLDRANAMIANLLRQDGGVMVARYGSSELMIVDNCLGVKSGRHPLRYICGSQEAWWWDKKYVDLMKNTGFFPSTPDNLQKFSELIIEDSKYLDLLGSWVQNEKVLADVICDVPKTRLQFLEPYFSKNPWTAELKGKKVLVVHPFAASIKSQYAKRELLFENPDVLPEFASFQVIPAVQSIDGDSRFSDWFEALDWMKSEIDKSDYDVCLIGCGAYGFPLAAHVKRRGKKAVHLGGVLQLLFGIRGRRWDGQNYGVNIGFKPGQYASLPNRHWIRPASDERPASAANVENACYW